MEQNKKYCFLPEHSENEAISFCLGCKQFMCNKCEKQYSERCKNHTKYKIDNNNQKDTFIGYCLEKNHLVKLSYYCKQHNNLCCGLCITRIKDKLNGQHSNCDICSIEDIEKEKHDKLKENIQRLDNMSNNLKDKIEELKNIFNKINENKENLKLKVQKIFTKLRSELNNREDKLLNEIDNIYNENYFKEDIIKLGEKLPDKIKKSLEQGKIIDNNWNNNQLNLSIFNCINIEKYINDIDMIETELKKSNLKNNLEIKFFPEENEINYFIENIKNFGKIYTGGFIFKKCPINMNEDRKFEISGKNQNIFTKTGKDKWMGTICEYPLNQLIEEHIWKIKILKTSNYYIMIGIATSDFDFNRVSYDTNNNFGWYYYCCTGGLWSGPPHNYQNKGTNLKSGKNEVIVVMNMKKRSLKFIIEGEDKGDSYINIPLEKPIFPSVLLGSKDDCVEIIDMNKK